VLGYLVENLSGMSFGEFLRTRLFEPLGMNDTAFWVPPDKTERFTCCYQPETKEPGLRLQDDARESTYATPPRLESGGGGLVSTAQDYLRFCRMMLNGGALDGVQYPAPRRSRCSASTTCPIAGRSPTWRCPGCSASPAMPGSAFRSAAASISTWPKPA